MNFGSRYASYMYFTDCGLTGICNDFDPNLSNAN